MEEEVNSYLTFTVNDGLYGVHVTKVVEIMAYTEPNSKSSRMDYMLGLIEHRGHILPLIDTGRKFGVGALNINAQTYIVVISVSNGDELFDVALAVDSVRQVIEITEESRKQIETSYKPGYVAFASQTADGLALVLDTDKVFTDTDVIEMAQLTTAANK